MSEENKIVELKDEELSKVTGGFTQNADGTYNILKDELFGHGITWYSVLCDNYNVGLDDSIMVLHYILYSDSTLDTFGEVQESVRNLLKFGGYLK